MTVTQSLQMTRPGLDAGSPGTLCSLSVSPLTAVASARGSDLATLQGLTFSVLAGRHP